MTGMSAYMFNPALSLLTRGLSSFHFWFPFCDVYCLAGRDTIDGPLPLGRTCLEFALVCYFLMPAPPPPPDNPNLPVNINYVYGLNDERPQHWMPPLAYLVLMMCALPVVIYLPTHILLSKLFGNSKQKHQAGTIADERKDFTHPLTNSL